MDISGYLTTYIARTRHIFVITCHLCPIVVLSALQIFQVHLYIPAHSTKCSLTCMHAKSIIILLCQLKEESSTSPPPVFVVILISPSKDIDLERVNQCVNVNGLRMSWRICSLTPTLGSSPRPLFPVVLSGMMLIRFC